LAARASGRTETVPVFTCYRSTSEAPSYTPTTPGPTPQTIQARLPMIKTETLLRDGRLHRNICSRAP